jgi:hypothetical protein
MKCNFVKLFLVLFSSIFFIVSPANAVPNYVDISVCNLSSPITNVCYVSATINRGGVFYQVGVDFELAVSDNDADGGASFSLVVSESGPNYKGASGATTAQAGDLANFVILYPTSLSIGTKLKTAVFAIHKAKDFTYTKEVQNISGSEVLRFTMSYQYYPTWYKFDCGFDRTVAYDYGFSQPLSQCEVDGRDQVEAVNASIDFFAHRDIEIALPIFDGGYLSYSGAGVSWGFGSDEFAFQVIGPRYTSSGARNFGQLEVYMPANAIDYFFGFSFVPGTDLVVSRKDYAPGTIITDVLEASDGMTFSERSGGLIVEISSYPFSAPAFTFTNPNKSSSAPGDGDTSSPSGGGSGASVVQPQIAAAGAQFVLPNPVKVKDSFFKSLNPSEIGSISINQFAKLPVKTIALLSPSQADALTFEQLKALKPSQVVALKPSVIAVLDSSQIAALQPADFKRMKTTQISRISGEAAAGLAKSDLNSFSRTQLRSLNTKAVKGLNPVVLKSLSINKLRQFSPSQIRSLTDEQKSVLTKTQKRALRIK